jgi:hypothetical protein
MGWPVKGVFVALRGFRVTKSVTIGRHYVA